MRVFKCVGQEGYDMVQPANASDYERLRLDGRPLGSGWKPICMQRVASDDDEQPLKRSDLPSCSGGEMMLLRKKAAEGLGDFLRASGELLPLACDDGEELWTLNVTKLLEALDEEHSDVLRMGDTGKILRVRRASFLPERLRGAEIFKLRSVPRGLIYVTGAFVDRVGDLGLKGLTFREVWSTS